jgi:hypothetical protein
VKLAAPPKLAPIHLPTLPPFSHLVSRICQRTKATNEKADGFAKMPSLPPSPLKRPPLVDSNSSNQPLSPSSKQSTHKPNKPHVAGRGSHSRQLSHGKNLNKLGRNTSATSLLADASRNHRRQKSGPTPPTHSPKPSPIKRNASHAVLPRNAQSQVNLRKNHSAIVLGRNVSHPALKKSGLAPAVTPHRQPKPKKKVSTFELGDKSSDEGELEDEEEAEWEDSSASPGLARDNTVTLSPPNRRRSEPTPQPEKPPDLQSPRPSKAAFPPNTTRVAPDPSDNAGVAPSLKPSGTTDPPSSLALFPHKPRSTRAPPAMSSVLVHATSDKLSRNNSSGSFTRITHADASSSKDTLGFRSTQSTSGPHASSSADGGVSHFLPSSTPGDRAADDNDSDYDSPSNFIPNYQPQPSPSPEKHRTHLKALGSNVPSRTQQRLELQRRETMRSSASAQSTPPNLETGFGLGSSASLHSQSGSRGRRDRSAGAGSDVKAVKRDYEASVKQMGVVRRFRNPVLESLQRLKGLGVLPPESGVLPPKGATSATATKRPPSRRGQSNVSGNGNPVVGGAAPNGLSRSLEEKPASPMASGTSGRSRGGGQVRFQRQGSHDDIGLSRSRGSYDEGEVEERADPDDEDSGVSPEEALLRRMWESREVYDRGEGART